MGYNWTIYQDIHKNDGSGEVAYRSNSGFANVPQGSSYSVNVSIWSNPFSRTGHDFIGYATSPNGGVSWQPGEGYTTTFSAGTGSDTIRLYCKWRVKAYTVSYDSNGGTGAPASQTKTYGQNLTLSSAVPTRTNYVFKGWATSSTGAVAYQPGETYSADESVTLYAIWEVAAGMLNSVSDTAIGSSGTASWTKVKNTDAYKLKISFGNAPQVTVDVAANTESCSFAIPSTWYPYISGATSGMATAILETYTDANYGTFVGSTSKTFTVSVPASVKPSISAFTAVPHSANATVNNWGVAVQGYSYATLSVTAAAGSGASITNIEFSGPSISKSGTSTTENTGTITDTGTLTYTVTVTDSRGRTETETVTLVTYEYANPTVSALTAVRCFIDGTASDNEGNYIKAFPVFVFSSVNGNNSLSIKKIEYKEHDVLTWTVGIASAVSGSWSSAFGPADVAKAFDVKLTITDAIGNTYALEVTVQSVDGYGFGLKNDRVRFGGPVRKPGFECNFDAEFTGIVDVTQRRCSKELNASGWFRVLTYEAGNSAEAQGAVGFVIDMAIGKDGTNSEAHKVSLFGVYGEVDFIDETSVSATQAVDKIRYTYETSSPYNAYVDIHLSANPQSVISVDFSVKTKPSYQGLFKALSLDAVADTPSGETVLVTHNLTANSSEGGSEWSAVIEKSGSTSVPLPNDWTELYYNLRDDNTFGFSGTILKSSMLSASEYYWIGWYHTASDNAYGYIQVGADFIKTAALVHNGSSTLADSKLRVQYKT